MEKKSFFKESISFLPLLLLYILLVFLFSNDTLFGDESRHIGYAQNIVNGFYTESENPELRNGPGYPLVLVPFVALNMGLLAPKLLNALVVFLALVYFKKTISLFTESKHAILFAYALGLYPPLLRWIPFLYSEPLAVFILCALMFHVCRLLQSKKNDWKALIPASLYLGLLVLVKIVFLQVIGVSFIIIGALFLWKRKSAYKKTSLLLAGSFVWIAPYLIYTFLLTGKLFFVGTGGGEILYHRSTPFENEWGNWFSRNDVLKGEDADYVPAKVYKDLSQLSKNHKDVYLQLEPLTYIQRDSAFKSIAIKNMKAHPTKYVKNTVSNVGRLLFNYPFSYRTHNMSAYGYMIPNMCIVVLLILCAYPFFISRRKTPFELLAIFIFTSIYIGGIVLLDGRGRNFIIAVPTLVLFFAYMFTNVLKVQVIAPTK